jgi:hypothetical protein
MAGINRFRREERTMKPMAAALAGSLISGVAMYAVGARASQYDAFVETPAPALVQTLEQQQPRAMLVSNNLAPRPVARTQSRRPVYRTDESRPVYRTADQSDDIVYREPEVRRDERTKTKTALIIGGSAASGAGVGAIVGGKKGALIGAALGGGAASIYEATKRR